MIFNACNTVLLVRAGRTSTTTRRCAPTAREASTPRRERCTSPARPALRISAGSLAPSARRTWRPVCDPLPLRPLRRADRANGQGGKASGPLRALRPDRPKAHQLPLCAGRLREAPAEGSPQPSPRRSAEHAELNAQLRGENQAMKVYRLSDDAEGAGGLIVSNPDQLLSELESCEPGDGPYTIHVEEMDETDYKTLPEWDGF